MISRRMCMLTKDIRAVVPEHTRNFISHRRSPKISGLCRLCANTLSFGEI